VEHRGIAFSVVEMTFPRSWKWTVGKSRTVTAGVCASRLEAYVRPKPLSTQWWIGQPEPSLRLRPPPICRQVSAPTKTLRALC
jgi:hypothetical protein